MILGAVLAGGMARRFGSDKAVAMLAGRPLIEHALAAFDGVAPGVIVVGRDWPGTISVADRPMAGLGPLGGLNAALHHGAAVGARAVLTLGCDTPDVPRGLLAMLAARTEPAFLSDLPVIGIWPTALAARLDAFVTSDPKRSMRGWAAVCGAEALASPPLANVNRPGDLAALQKR